MRTLQSFLCGEWVSPATSHTTITSAFDQKPVAALGDTLSNAEKVLTFARNTGGPELRKLNFHDRAKILKALGDAIIARKEELYAISFTTGATRADSWIDIEGGAGTLFAYAAKGRRELPPSTFILDGAPETLSKKGTFLGQHILTPLKGVAIHINAFNFPVWGMLEKIAPCLLAGVPAIVKPASASAQLAEAAFRILLETGLVPKGALQLVTGTLGDTFDHLTGQDVVSFTGSAATAETLNRHPVIARESVRFIAERDSLNAAVLGPDAGPGTPEFDLFIKEVAREMTVKAGQKCTAIRRAIVPKSAIDAVEAALKRSLSEVVTGDPADAATTLGCLINERQKRDVESAIERLSQEARVVTERKTLTSPSVLLPVLLRCDAPVTATSVHEVEAFGPVATLMPYNSPAEAVTLVNKGKGSLVMSVFTYEPSFIQALVTGSASFHGRLAIIDRDCAKEHTGHGSPLPSLIHGGPGRAGGGEEMGGLRGVMHYMQRTAIQASPKALTAISGVWQQGAAAPDDGPHPFRLRYGELELGRTLNTKSRTITLEDVEHFAHFTGDTFYAHMDEKAAAANPLFGGRVAHGYLLLSFAAGLFVDPDPGPVLANYGLDNLRFIKPVKPGETIKVQLTVKAKSLRSEKMGEVRWAVLVTNQSNEPVASYELLTMNAI